MANEAHAEGPDGSDELPLEPWPEPVDGRALLDEIRAFFLCFVVLPKWVPQTVAMWVMHTFAVELRRVATYLGVESPEKECGKTTLMTLLSKLVNRPLAASNVSSPAFYRAIHELRPTLLIDEADTLLPGNAQLRGILNSGYTLKMAYVLRVTNERREGEMSGWSERRSRLARYSCFGPKAIAQIGHLPETLADRCLVMRLQRKLPTEECGKLRDLDESLLARQCVNNGFWRPSAPIVQPRMDTNKQV